MAELENSQKYDNLYHAALCKYAYLREKEISSFQKQKFYQVEIDCVDFCAISEKIESKTDAEKVKQKCLGKTAVVQSIEQKQKTEKPPKLYDLTTLQREANKIYGYTAQQTLEYLQALYEKTLYASYG